jgi:phosphatidylglycerophosphate synthase
VIASTHLQGPPQLLVRFRDRAAANRRIAGMSAAGRWVAHAREAGLEAIAFVAPGAGRWPPATRADFRRAGVVGGVPIVDAEAPQPGTVRVVDGRFLPSPEQIATGGPPIEPLDLDRPAQASRRILQATAKSSDGIISRWINRPISQAISQALLAAVPGVRPTQVTLAVAAIAIIMVLALLTGGTKGLVWGGILFQLASVLDGVDGEIARASYRSSPAGAALDTRVDMLTNIGFFVGAAFALTRIYGGYQAIVGGTAVLFALTGLGITAWLLKRLDRPGSFDIIKHYYRDRFPGGWQWLVTETLVLMTSRDFFAFAFAVVIVLGFGWAVTWLLLGFTATYLFFVLCAVPGLLRAAAPAVRGISA